VADPPFAPEFRVDDHILYEGYILYLDVSHLGETDAISVARFIEDATEQWWWSLGRHDRHMRVEIALGDVMRVETDRLLEAT
jgi:hypothetical protein